MNGTDSTPEMADKPPKLRRTNRCLLGGLVALLLVFVGSGIWFKMDSDQSIAQVENELQASQEEVADPSQSLIEADAREADLQAELSDMEAELSETSTGLATLETELAETNLAVSRFMAAALGSQGIGTENASCMADALVEADGAAPLPDSFSDAAADPSRLSSPVLGLGASILTAADSCGISGADLLGSDSTANAYGDSPEFDALYEACESGSGAACDQLYWDSPLGSEYERLGATCGDRFTMAHASLLCEGEI